MLELRNRLLNANSSAKEYLEANENDSKRNDYLYDLRFGIELYLLLKEKYQFNTRQASDDGIWIYLSMKVIPDLVYKRWGLSESRFYKQSRRIWLRTMWWYVHLSWAGDKEETYNILRGFTTDEVVQLVERSGPHGYRIEVTRELMKQFSKIDNKNVNRNLFRKIMKLNTARVKIIEPSLTVGGVHKYVEELINYFNETDAIARKEDSFEYTQNS